MQISKTQTILTTSHLMHTRQTILLANSSSQIQAPQNGACLNVFFLAPVRPWRLEIPSIACSVETLHPPLCNACVVPCTTLKHDQTCIRSGRLISRAHPFPPRFCPGSIARLLATSPIQRSTLTRHAFHSPFLGYRPCSSLLLRVLSPHRSHTSGPCCRLTLYAPPRLRLMIPRSFHV